MPFSSSTWIGLLQNFQAEKALRKVDTFSEDTKIFFFSFPKKKTFHAVQTHYVTQLLIHHARGLASYY